MQILEFHSGAPVFPWQPEHFEATVRCSQQGGTGATCAVRRSLSASTRRTTTEPQQCTRRQLSRTRKQLRGRCGGGRAWRAPDDRLRTSARCRSGRVRPPPPWCMSSMLASANHSRSAHCFELARSRRSDDRAAAPRAPSGSSARGRRSAGGRGRRSDALGTCRRLTTRAQPPHPRCSKTLRRRAVSTFLAAIARTFQPAELCSSPRALLASAGLGVAWVTDKPVATVNRCRAQRR